MDTELFDLLYEPQCVFCHLWKDQASSVKEIDQMYFSINPLVAEDEVHLLICPKYHLTSYFNLTEAARTNKKNHFTLGMNKLDPENQKKRDLIRDQYLKSLLLIANKKIQQLDLAAARIIVNYYPPYAEQPHSHLHLIGHRKKIS